MCRGQAWLKRKKVKKKEEKKKGTGQHESYGDQCHTVVACAFLYRRDSLPISIACLMVNKRLVFMFYVGKPFARN